MSGEAHAQINDLDSTAGEVDTAFGTEPENFFHHKSIDMCSLPVCVAKGEHMSIALTQL